MARSVSGGVSAATETPTGATLEAGEGARERELAAPTLPALEPASAASTASQEPAVPAAIEPSLRHLFGRLGIVEARVRMAVDRRRAGDPDPEDRFRGLYISDAQVDQLFAGPTVLDL